MMRMLQSCIAKGVLRINPRFEEVIIALSAQNKGDNPYSMNKTKLVYHDTLDSIRLALCCMRHSSSSFLIHLD